MSTISEQVVDTGLRVEDQWDALNREVKRLESVLSKLDDHISKAIRCGKQGALARTLRLKTKLDAVLKRSKGLRKMRRDELNMLVQMFEEIGGLDSFIPTEPVVTGMACVDEAQLMEGSIKPVALWNAEPSVFSPSSNAKPWGP